MKTFLMMAVVALGLAFAPEAEAAGKKAKMTVTGQVNLNQATASQLDLLPGVGAKAAERIVAHRQKTPFAKVEDLVKVKGFGKKKFEKLKPYLTVSGPTTLKAQRVPADAGAAQARMPPKK